MNHTAEPYHERVMFDSREQIENWLFYMGVHKYAILEDLTVNVNQNVSLITNLKYQRYIPVNFGTINGAFDCSGVGLISLIGCPHTVNGGFYCQDNNLTDLVGMPTHIDGYIDAKGNALTSLIGAPEILNDTLDLRRTPITSLEGLPKKFPLILLTQPSIVFQELQELYPEPDVEGNYELFLRDEQTHMLLERGRLNHTITKISKAGVEDIKKIIKI